MHDDWEDCQQQWEAPALQKGSREITFPLPTGNRTGSGQERNLASSDTLPQVSFHSLNV